MPRFLLTACALLTLTLCAACGLDATRFRELDIAARQLYLALGKPALTPSDLEQARAPFRTALQARASDIASRQERELLEVYRAADTAAADLAALFERRGSPDNVLLPVSDPLIERIWKTYDLPVNTNEPPSIYFAEAGRAIVDVARQRLNEATDHLNR